MKRKIKGCHVRLQCAHGKSSQANIYHAAARTRQPNVFIKTFGCQMNNRDSEVVKGLLVAQGFRLVDLAQKADVVLFNTCSVRQHAEDRVWSEVGKVKRRKLVHGLWTMDDRPIIGIIGCMAQTYKEKIFKRAPQVDFVVGPADIHKIPEIIKNIVGHKSQVTSHKKNNKIVETTEEDRPEEIYRTGFHDSKNHAYVVISEGCDNYCSYCVVPYARGRLRHRAVSDIVREVEDAVRRGITYISLLGQNVNSYEGRDLPAGKAGKREEGRKVDFVELLKKVSEIRGLKKLSFFTSHPKDTTRELFELMRDTPVIEKYLHMPMQSGSDRILKLMHRGYTAKKYLALVDLYRSIVYNGKIGSDIIVGFPSETEKDFKKTYDLVERIRFDAAFIFKYSPRPHAKASQMKDDVPEDAKSKRHTKLLEFQRRISKE